MMMRMLEAGGMPVLADDSRPPDADNPQGYYECEAVKHLQTDAAFLAQAAGKAVKVISALLSALPQDYRYNILFMQRHLEEVFASQRRMLQRQGKPVPPDDTRMAQRFARHIHEVTTWLAQQEHMRVLPVNYNAVLAEPYTHAQAIQLFLGRPLQVDNMVAVVEQQLYRNRAAPHRSTGSGMP
jgi:hypothetical protein